MPLYSTPPRPLPLIAGGLQASLSDPGSDRLLFWRDSLKASDFMQLGNNFVVAGTFMDTAQGIQTTSSPTFNNLSLTTLNNLVPPFVGSYTPTLTDVANITSHNTVSDLNYIRAGSGVVVWGRVSIDPTLAATATELGISLPVASNFSLFTDCGGNGSAGGVVSLSGQIRADTTNDRASLVFISTAGIAAADWSVFFGYRII